MLSMATEAGLEADDAVRRLLVAGLPQARRLATYMLRDPHDAEDAVGARFRQQGPRNLTCPPKLRRRPGAGGEIFATRKLLRPGSPESSRTSVASSSSDHTNPHTW